MSVIAVTGVHGGSVIKGPFETLNFTVPKNAKNVKTCYLHLSERLDPTSVIERINTAKIKTRKKLLMTAYIPEKTPDLQVRKFKGKHISLKLQNELKLSCLPLPHELIFSAHHELFLELQYKYPGLYYLSGKTSHKLLDEIAVIIGDRLMDLMDYTPDLGASCIALTKQYRRVHLHSRDFHLVLSTLHRLQEGAGAPCAQIKERDLLNFPPEPRTSDINLDGYKTVASKYSERVIEAITKHLATATSHFDEDSFDIAEDMAKKNIREALKKSVPSLHEELKQVIEEHFVPELQEPSHRNIRIYGEPYLPAGEVLGSFIGRHKDRLGSVGTTRSTRMYNLLVLRVPTNACSVIQAMDGAIVDGVRLRVRMDIAVLPVKESLRVQLASQYGGLPPDPPESEDEDELEQDDPQLKQDAPQLKQDAPQLKQDAPQLKQDAPQLKQDAPQLKQDAQSKPVPEVPSIPCSPQTTAMCLAATILLRSIYGSGVRH